MEGNESSLFFLGSNSDKALISFKKKLQLKYIRVLASLTNKV